MNRLAAQLIECENQPNWLPEHVDKVNELDGVIRRLSAGQSVSPDYVSYVCKNTRKYCFLGLEEDTCQKKNKKPCFLDGECQETSCSFVMQCEL